MAKGTKAEQRKRFALVALGGLFVFVLVYQFLLSGPSRPERKATNANVPAASTQNSNSSQAGSGQPARPKAPEQAEEAVAILMQDLTPLDLSFTQASASAEVDKERGSIFGYWIKPPDPPPIPPPPPPIQLTGVNPAGAVAGTPRKVTLTIFGNKMPEDAQVYFEGNPKASRRAGENQLAIDLEPGEYAYARNIGIEVKGKSDPAKMNSNIITFNVQAAPEPQFRYIGRLGDQGIFDLPATKEVKRLTRGELIGGQWRIDSITDQAVELTHTQYEIKRRVPMTDKTR